MAVESNDFKEIIYKKKILNDIVIDNLKKIKENNN